MHIAKSFAVAALLVSAWPVAAGAQAPASSAGSAAPPAAAAPAREPGLYMTFQTDKGSIACKLYEKEAPNTVRTMVGLAIGKKSYVDPRTHQTVRKKFFDGLTFHRVIPGFMIQGGDPLGTGMGSPEGPGFPFGNEVAPGLRFDVAGRLAMANTGEPNSDGSQFFITEAPQASLNGGYTIWGQCENPDVVKAIASVQRDADDKPLTPVHMVHVVVERVGPAPPNAPEAMPAPAPKPAPKPAATTAPKSTTPGTSAAPKAPATKATSSAH